jgi:hypothetical protein
VQVRAGVGGRIQPRPAVALSDFGKPVSFQAPKDFEPLEKVFEGLFSGIG